jgi:hypothetical protein
MTEGIGGRTHSGDKIEDEDREEKEKGKEERGKDREDREEGRMKFMSLLSPPWGLVLQALS